MHKATFLAGLGVGYVLGARAGRARYDSIVRTAQRVADNPQVQQTASTVSHQASGLAAQASRLVGGRVSERVPHPLGGQQTHAYSTPNGRQRA